jgi:multiple sugar transport system permease protein
MRRTRQRRVYSPWVGLLFLLPALLHLIIVNTLPILFTVFYSFTNYTLGSPIEFKGLQNYSALTDNSEFRQALGVTLKLGLGLALPGSLVAFLLSLAISKGRKTGVFSTILFIPVIYPSVVSAFIWGAAFSGDGFVNRYLGLEVEWLTSYTMALPSLIFVLFWTNLGFYVVISLTGIKGISPSYYEAASLDGASEWHKLRWITYPLMKPVLIFIAIIATSEALQIFTQPTLLTSGGPGTSTRVLAGLIYQVLFERFEIGLASAMAVALAIVALFVALIQYLVITARRR